MGSTHRSPDPAIHSWTQEIWEDRGINLSCTLLIRGGVPSRQSFPAPALQPSVFLDCLEHNILLTPTKPQLLLTLSRVDTRSRWKRWLQLPTLTTQQDSHLEVWKRNPTSPSASSTLPTSGP